MLEFPGLGIGEGVSDGLNEGVSGMLVTGVSEGVNTELRKLVNLIDMVLEMGARKLAIAVEQRSFYCRALINRHSAKIN